MVSAIRVLALACLHLFHLSSAYRIDLIRNVTMGLSSYFHIKCLVLFHKFTDTENMEYFDTFKALSSGLAHSVRLYTFEERQRGKSCPKPMNILIGEQLKREFAGFTTRSTMANEIWLIFHLSPVLDFFQNARPSFDSEVVAAEIVSSRKVRLREVYRVDNDYPLRIEDFGMWTRENGLSLPKKSLYDRRSDLEGMIMRVGSNENWPVCSFHNGVWDGYMPRIWKEIGTTINITTVPVSSVDNATGLQFPNGSWNGLMGMLLNKDIDVIAAELTLTKSRMKVIKFSHPAIRAKYQIYFKALGYRLEWKAIFRPLALSIWLSLFAWLIIGSVCISASYRWYIRSGFQESDKINFTRTESFFFILQTLCQQGYPVVPKSLSCRILFVTAYALSTIMIPSYSASLISSLTHQSHIRPFDSLKDMVNDGKYKLLVKRNSAAYSQFAQASDPLYAKVYTKLMSKIDQNLNIHLDNTVQVLDDYICRDKRYALYGIDMIVEIKMKYKQPECSVLTLTNPLTPVFTGLGLRKDSPFIKLIDYKMQKLQDVGLISRLKTGIHPLGRSRNDYVFRQVEVNEIFQMFLLLLLGMVIAVGILALEKIMFKYEPGSLRRMNLKSGERSGHVKCFDFYMD